MIEKHRERAILRAVELYYFEGLTQAAISERLGCTRWTVGRLLQEAEQEGIVKVSVHHPNARCHDLEVRLTDRYNLKYARVIPCADSFKKTLAALARAGADLLTDVRPRPHTVGLAYGRTIGAVARAVPDTWDRGTKIVQVSAAPALIHDAMVGSSVRLLGKRTGGESWTLPATPVFRSAADLAAAAAEMTTAACLQSAAEAEVLLYSPGIIDEDTVLLKHPVVTEEESNRIRTNGAVAIVGNRIIDRAGNAVDPDVDSRTLGLSLEQFRDAPLSVAVSAGAVKVEALTVVLGAGLAKAVVVDCETAAALLAGK